MFVSRPLKKGSQPHAPESREELLSDTVQTCLNMIAPVFEYRPPRKESQEFNKLQREDERIKTYIHAYEYTP